MSLLEKASGQPFASKALTEKSLEKELRMEPAPKRPTLFSGLAKILHLHQLPQANEKPLATRMTRPSLSAMGTPTPSPAFTMETGSDYLPRQIPLKTASPPPLKMQSSSSSNQPPKPKAAQPTSPPLAQPLAPGPIVQGTNQPIITDYDKIYELVKQRQTIKLDEISRLLYIKEERVAQELQTLEDNGLVEVKYPAFGEPLICYKPQEE